MTIKEFLPIFFSALLGGTFSLLGSIIVLHKEAGQQRKQILWERQFALLGEIAAFFHALLRFTRQGSAVSEEMESISPSPDMSESKELEARWRRLEPQLWLLDQPLRERIYTLYEDVSHGSHAISNPSVLAEVEKEIDILKEKLF